MSLNDDDDGDDDIDDDDVFFGTESKWLKWLAVTVTVVMINTGVVVFLVTLIANRTWAWHEQVPTSHNIKHKTSHRYVQAVLLRFPLFCVFVFCLFLVVHHAVEMRSTASGTNASLHEAFPVRKQYKYKLEKR